MWIVFLDYMCIVFVRCVCVVHCVYRMHFVYCVCALSLSAQCVCVDGGRIVCVDYVHCVCNNAHTEYTLNSLTFTMNTKIDNEHTQNNRVQIPTKRHRMPTHTRFT